MITKLKNIAMFKNIDNTILKDLIQNKDILVRSFHKGVELHEQFSPCHGVDIIVSGSLVAYSLSLIGNEINIFEFREGDIIGANLLFGKNNNYPVSIYSTSECEIFQISKSAVEILLKEYNFTMEYVKAISLNSENMNKKIIMHTQKTLRENLTDYLLTLSKEQNNGTIHLPISKKQLADYFGVQRPSLFRELKKMKDEGLLEIKNKTITLNYLD